MPRAAANFLLCAFALALSGCPASAPTASRVKADQDDLAPIGLGQPYASGGARFLRNSNDATCVAATAAPVFVGGLSGKMSSHLAQSFTSTLEEIGVQGRGEAHVAGINVEIETDFAHAVADSDLKVSFFNVFELEAGRWAMPGRKVTALGDSLLAKKALSDERQSRCGDAFVDQISFGARYLVGLTFHFKDHETKEKFLLDLKVKAAFITVIDAQWNTALATSLQDVIAEVVVAQTGGDPAARAQAVGEGLVCPGHAASAENFLKPCLAQFRRLTDYGRDQLRPQLTAGIAALRAGRASAALPVVGFETRRYDEVGLWPLQPRRADELSAADAAFQAMDFLRSASSYYRRRGRDFNLRLAAIKAEPSSTTGAAQDLEKALAIAGINEKISQKALDRCAAELDGDSTPQSARSCFASIRAIVGPHCEVLEPMALDAAGDPKATCALTPQT